MAAKNEIKKRQKPLSAQSERDEIIPWLDDDSGRLLDGMAAEHLQAEGTTPGQSSPMASELTVEASPSLVVHREEDVFSHRMMPKTIHWSVPWSDLMMTMFILFAVLYIYQSTKREFVPREGQGSDLTLNLKNTDNVHNEVIRFDDEPDFSKLYDLSRQTLEAGDLNHFASVDLVEDKAVRIILTSDLLFDTGKAALKPEAREKLRAITPIITQTPYMINVVGHTDNVPIHSAPFPTNWELSVVRASVVARFFIEEMLVPANKFYLSGHSYFQPLRPNTTAKYRAMNRRVEIIITRKRPNGTLISNENFLRSSYNSGYALSASDS